MTKDVTPAKTGSYTYSDSTSESDQTEVKITKRDQATAVVLSGVKFQFFRDGKSVGTAVTDEKGVASLTYNETISSGTKKVTKNTLRTGKNYRKMIRNRIRKKDTMIPKPRPKLRRKKKSPNYCRGSLRIRDPRHIRGRQKRSKQM